MSFYQDLQATALRLLDAFGQKMTLTRPGIQIYDPVRGSIDEDVPDQIDTVGLFSTVRRDLFANVETGDRQLILAGTVPVEQGDTIQHDGLLWSVVEVVESNPAGTALAFFVRVRR
jgi:hypothetical protein